MNSSFPVQPLKAILWIAILGMAWAAGQFLQPDHTIASAGLAGYTTREMPLFNWDLFLKLSIGMGIAIPLLSFRSGDWLSMLVEAALLGLLAALSWNLADQLQGEAELGGLQGWKERAKGWIGMETEMQRTFNAGPLLMLHAAAVGLWILFQAVRNYMESRSRTMLIHIVLSFIVAAALLCYYQGLHSPLFYSVRFWVITQEVSLADSVHAFLEKGEIFLAVILITFTFVFPLIKFAALSWALLTPADGRASKMNKILGALGKWSMLDVFVVALLLLNMKLDSGLLDMELRTGVIWFSASILLTMLCSAWLGLIAPAAGSGRNGVGE